MGSIAFASRAKSKRESLSWIVIRDKFSSSEMEKGMDGGGSVGLEEEVGLLVLSKELIDILEERRERLVDKRMLRES